MLLGPVAAAGEARIVNSRIISKSGLPIANRARALPYVDEFRTAVMEMQRAA